LKKGSARFSNSRNETPRVREERSREFLLKVGVWVTGEWRAISLMTGGKLTVSTSFNGGVQIDRGKNSKGKVHSTGESVYGVGNLFTEEVIMHRV